MKIEDLSANSPIRQRLGQAIKVCVSTDGTMRIITNPVPGHKLSVRPISSQAAIIVEECEDELYLLDVLCIDNPNSQDAKTREGLRVYREQTGILVTPLKTMTNRTPLAIPEGVHTIFWAYHK